MNEIWYFVVLFAVLFCPYQTVGKFQGIEREKCKSREGMPFRPHSDQRHRIHDLRKEMRLHGILAYIVTSYDEHLNEDISDRDKRRQFISGFTGSSADVVITLNSVALWTDDRYLAQANSELNCDWKIFRTNDKPSITDWIASEIGADTSVHANPHTIPHFLWLKWEAELHRKFIRLIPVDINLVDLVWRDRPAANQEPIRIHPVKYAGETWQSKIERLRSHLVSARCDSIVVTSLTEIAYILNLRGNDLPHTPVFKAYLIVTHQDILLYLNTMRVDIGIRLHFNDNTCPRGFCVRISNYDAIWDDLRRYSMVWRRVLVPSHYIFDLGTSHAIYSRLHLDLILERPSPIIFMRAEKNKIERANMRRARTLDAIAMCQAMSLLERRYENGETLTEMSVASDVDISHYEMTSNRGLAYDTIVAYGPHSSNPLFHLLPELDLQIFDKNTIIIDSGGQYLEGTTAVSRTIHLGEPSAEQKKAYTNVLSGIIRFSNLNFPADLQPAELDSLLRGPVWLNENDYPQPTAHGIGSYLSVLESPISMSYSANQDYTFRDGNIFTIEPGFYKQGEFGVRLKNMMEVYDDNKKLPNGQKLLSIRQLSIVPYESKLIDLALLTVDEKKWLNEHNAKIRDILGDELKNQNNAKAFHWMMNKTRHIIEYYSESEYRKNKNHSIRLTISNSFLITIVLNLIVFFNLA